MVSLSLSLTIHLTLYVTIYLIIIIIIFITICKCFLSHYLNLNLYHTGGAGVIDRKSIEANIYYKNLSEMLQDCYSYINENEDKDTEFTAVDIAEYCVKLLENNELFNAGILSLSI
jgi:hypothetical protein